MTWEMEKMKKKPKPTKKNTRNRRAQDLSFSFFFSPLFGFENIFNQTLFTLFYGCCRRVYLRFQIWNMEEGLGAEEWIIRTPMRIRATRPEQEYSSSFYFTLISYNICHNYTYLSHVYYIFIITPVLHIIIYFWHIFFYLF